MGIPERDKNLEFYFDRIREKEEELNEAIKTGKRGTRNPLVISQFYELGIDFDEFIVLTDDIPLFCKATLNYK